MFPIDAVGVFVENEASCITFRDKIKWKFAKNYRLGRNQRLLRRGIKHVNNSTVTVELKLLRNGINQQFNYAGRIHYAFCSKDPVQPSREMLMFI